MGLPPGEWLNLGVVGWWEGGPCLRGTRKDRAPPLPSLPACKTLRAALQSCSSEQGGVMGWEVRLVPHSRNPGVAAAFDLPVSL